MEVIIQPDRDAACEIAARMITRLVHSKPRAVLGLATGESPIPLYRKLVERHRRGELDFGEVTTFNLDEYAGIEPGHPASYHRFMREQLIGQVNLAADRAHIPDGLAEDIPSFCEAYERWIADAGGIDLQVLGIGADGHIGFNEPGSSLASRTRIKTLAPRTVEDNARNFPAGAVPHHAITMGVGTILEAREIVLLAFGARKARALAAAVEGPVTASVPASALQLHPRVCVLADEAAAAGLERAAYYRRAFAMKPDWQRA